MASATRSQSAAQPQNDKITSAKPVSVLFVCLGNICRSPMAEGVFRSLTNFDTPQQHPLIARIDSCGTGGYHTGSQPDSRTISVLKSKAGITNYRHQARKIRTPADFEEFDYILASDEGNLIDLRDIVKRAQKKGQLSGEELSKIHLFGAFGGKSADEEIQDPWYDGGKGGFEIAYDQVTRFGKGLLKHIEEEVKKEE